VCVRSAEGPGWVRPRAEELRGAHVAAAAPRWEWMGSAELCSVWQRQSPREGMGLCQGRGRWGSGRDSAPQEGGHGTAPWQWA